MDTRIRTLAVAASALLLLPLGGAAFALVEPLSGAARGRAQPPEGLSEMLRVLRRPPQTNEPYLRAWWAHRDANLGVAYAVIPRRVPMHVHLDADHVILVVEGWAHVSVGGRKAVLGPGDLVVIPRGMAHEISRGGANRLVVVDTTSPAGDMAKTFWIESPTAPPATP